MASIQPILNISECFWYVYKVINQNQYTYFTLCIFSNKSPDRNAFLYCYQGSLKTVSGKATIPKISTNPYKIRLVIFCLAVACSKTVSLSCISVSVASELLPNIEPSNEVIACICYQFRIQKLGV